MAKPIEAVHQQVGLRIRAIREALGLNQEELAKRIGVERTSIANIEAGRQRMLLHTVEEFSRALGTTTRHLLKGIWW